MINTILGIVGIIALVAVIVFLVIATIALCKLLKDGIIIKEKWRNTIKEIEPAENTGFTQREPEQITHSPDITEAQKQFDIDYKKLYEESGMDAVIQHANKIMGIETIEKEEGK